MKKTIFLLFLITLLAFVLMVPAYAGGPPGKGEIDDHPWGGDAVASVNAESPSLWDKISIGFTAFTCVWAAF